MRRLIVPTCLAVSAWAQPAGPMLEFFPTEPTNISIVNKTSDVAAESVPVVTALHVRESAAPAETTSDVTLFDDDEPIMAEEPAEYGILAEAPPPIPLPPRRAVPHAIVCEVLADAASDNNLPTPFFIRLIYQESGFKQNVVSRAGAQGVAQFMPETAARYQADPFNPLEALRASARLLKDLFQQFGNIGLAAAAYNAGPRRVQDWLAKKGKLPQETRDYVQTITGRAPEQWKAKTVAGVPLHVPKGAPCQREAGLFAADGPDAIPLPPVSPATTLALAAEKKTAEKQAARTATKTAAKAASKTATKTASKTAAKVASKTAEKAADKTAQKPAVQTAAKAAKGKQKNVKVASASRGPR